MRFEFSLREDYFSQIFDRDDSKAIGLYLSENLRYFPGFGMVIIIDALFDPVEK